MTPQEGKEPKPEPVQVPTHMVLDCEGDSYRFDSLQDALCYCYQSPPERRPWRVFALRLNDSPRKAPIGDLIERGIYEIDLSKVFATPPNSQVDRETEAALDQMLKQVGSACLGEG